MDTPNKSMQAPPSGSRGGRSRTASIAIVLIVVLVAAGSLLYYSTLGSTALPTTTTAYTTAPTTLPTSTPTTVTVLPSPTIQLLVTPQNALFSLPQSPPMNDFFSNSSFSSFNTGWVISQYGANFTAPFFADPNITKPNQYTIQVPPRFANMTSPVLVLFEINKFANSSAALSNYIDEMKFFSNDTHMTNSGFSNVSQYNITGVGERAMFQNYVQYGLPSNTIYVVYGGYEAFITTSGTSRMRTGYVYNITDHMLSILSNATNG